MLRTPHVTFKVHDNPISKLLFTLRDNETNLLLAALLKGSQLGESQGQNMHTDQPLRSILSVLLFMSQGLHKLGTGFVIFALFSYHCKQYLIFSSVK